MCDPSSSAAPLYQGNTGLTWEQMFNYFFRDECSLHTRMTTLFWAIAWWSRVNKKRVNPDMERVFSLLSIKSADDGNSKDKTPTYSTNSLRVWVSLKTRTSLSFIWSPDHWRPQSCVSRLLFKLKNRHHPSLLWFITSQSISWGYWSLTHSQNRVEIMKKWREDASYSLDQLVMTRVAYKKTRTTTSWSVVQRESDCLF